MWTYQGGGWMHTFKTLRAVFIWSPSFGLFNQRNHFFCPRFYQWHVNFVVGWLYVVIYHTTEPVPILRFSDMYHVFYFFIFAQDCRHVIQWVELTIINRTLTWQLQTLLLFVYLDGRPLLLIYVQGCSVFDNGNTLIAEVLEGPRPNYLVFWSSEVWIVPKLLSINFFLWCHALEQLTWTFVTKELTFRILDLL